jgi:HK97 family phage major capsid protein
MSKLKEMRALRSEKYAALSAILSGADSPESRVKAKAIMAEMNDLKTQIEEIESKGLSRVGTGKDGDGEVEFRRAFAKYVRKGEARLTEEESLLLSEKRAIGEGTVTLSGQSSLGYFVPTGFQYDVETALKYYATTTTSTTRQCSLAKTRRLTRKTLPRVRSTSTLGSTAPALFAPRLSWFKTRPSRLSRGLRTDSESVSAVSLKRT